jgi:hypothetical protein
MFLVPPAVTNYYRLGCLFNKHLFFKLLEDGTSNIKVSADPVFGEGILVWLVDDCLLAVSS